MTRCLLNIFMEYAVIKWKIRKKRVYMELAVNT